MTNKKSLKNYVLLLSLFIYALIFFLLIVSHAPNYALTISGMVVCVATIAAYFCYGFQSYGLNEIRKKIIIEVLIGVVAYFTITYGLGMFTGFLKNSYSLRMGAIIKHSFIPLVAAVALEFFRYMFISSNRDSKGWIVVGTIIITLMDVILNYITFGSSLVEVFVYLSVIVLPIIFRNAFLSYVSYQVGYEACLVYIIPITLYKFFVPVLPDLGNYLTCITGITLPSMLFIYGARMITEFLDGKENKLKVMKVVLIDMPLVIFFTVLVGLVSGYFTYHLVGVEESNISPKINKGDAVMLYRNFDKSDLHIGDIIAYKSDDKIIIDRIANIKEENKVLKYYFIKEKNEDAEDSYRVMNIDDIMGKYIFRIKKIAWPTIKFKNFIRGDVNEG